jgi:Spy/CpxP family protein refolding chaperone
MKRTRKWLSAALAAVTVMGLLGMVDGVALAGQAGPGGPRGAQWGMGGPGLGLERFAQQLSLTDAQKASIREVVKQSRQAALANGGTPPNMAALLIPSDHGHQAAVDAAKQRAADRVQQMVDTQAKIYALLTPEQQAQLANLIANRPQRPTGSRR